MGRDWEYDGAEDCGVENGVRMERSRGGWDSEWG